MKKVLFLIDMQVDFVEGGSLAVSGGKKACEYVTNLIKEKGDEYCEIWVSQDYHCPNHIGFASSWVDEAGNHPAPFTQIKSTDRKWKCVYDLDPGYLAEIEKNGYVHTIWPDHCIEGTIGASIEPALMEALIDWKRKDTENEKPLIHYTKGNDWWVERYSVFSNADREAMSVPGIFEVADQIDIAGIAEDVCVYYTVRDLLKFIPRERLNFLKEGMAGIDSNRSLEKLLDL